MEGILLIALLLIAIFVTMVVAVGELKGLRRDNVKIYKALTERYQQDNVSKFLKDKGQL